MGEASFMLAGFSLVGVLGTNALQKTILPLKLLLLTFFAINGMRSASGNSIILLRKDPVGCMEHDFRVSFERPYIGAT